MQITPINYNNTNFKAINKKYFDWAKKDIGLTKSVSCDWIDRIDMDIFLFKEIGKQDALDTILAVKQYLKEKVGRESFAVEDLLNSIKKLP